MRGSRATLSAETGEEVVEPLHLAGRNWRSLAVLLLGKISFLALQQGIIRYFG
jgi:hypothetical protein